MALEVGDNLLGRFTIIPRSVRFLGSASVRVVVQETDGQRFCVLVVAGYDEVDPAVLGVVLEDCV